MRSPGTPRRIEHLAHSIERLQAQALEIVEQDSLLTERFDRLASSGDATTSALRILAELAVR